MSSPRFGRVVRATIPDSRGLAHEYHPAVIITPGDRIVAGGKFWVVGISTKSHLAAEDVRTAMQYGPQCRTGLTRKCWAFSDWLVELEVGDIHEYAGMAAPLTMAEIVSKIPLHLATAAGL